MEICLLVCDLIIATATTTDTISFDGLRFTWAASIRVFWSFHVLFAGQKRYLAPNLDPQGELIHNTNKHFSKPLLTRTGTLSTFKRLPENELDSKLVDMPFVVLPLTIKGGPLAVREAKGGT